MSEPHSAPASSHGLWYAVTVALPLLYLLSVPPVYFSFLQTPSTGGMFEVPQWVEFYIAPYGWLADIPLLADPMRSYFMWWVDVLDIKGVW